MNAEAKMWAAKAFMDDALAAHILASACSVLGLHSADDLLLPESTLPPTFTGVTKLSDDIVARFVDLQSMCTVANCYTDEVQQRAIDTLTPFTWTA